MKQVAALLLAGALVAQMLQPVIHEVNILSDDNVLRADGSPPPPFPPPNPLAMTADGGTPVGVSA